METPSQYLPNFIQFEINLKDSYVRMTKKYLIKIEIKSKRYTDGWTNGRMNTQTKGQTDRQKDKQLIEEHIDRRMVGWSSIG